MVGDLRLDNARAAVEDVVQRQIPGDIVETGIFKGGCLMFMKATLNSLGDTDRRVFGFDSFKVMANICESVVCNCCQGTT